MIAAVCAWHQHHAPATGEITRRLRAAEPMFIAAPAAVEAYAVLTRLPAPYRLASADALRLIEVSFTSAGRLVALNAHLYGALLRRAAGRAATLVEGPEDLDDKHNTQEPPRDDDRHDAGRIEL